MVWSNANHPEVVEDFMARVFCGCLQNGRKIDADDFLLKQFAARDIIDTAIAKMLEKWPTHNEVFGLSRILS
ncbi:MAG: hypothetical protein HRT36_03880 [Alphaproteobacteria bacterium]|nr:hypothetical protein [Alphaproteobacteria bacterium]